MSRPTQAQDNPVITIGRPEITTSGRSARWSVRVNGDGLPDELWYEVASEHADMLTERADAAVIALALPAMHRAASLCVDGPLTDEVAFTFREAQALYETLGRGHGRPLVARTTLPAAPHANGVATGFSGGIDSFAVLAERHYAGGIPDSHRLTHLLFNNVGSHGWGERADHLGRARLERLRPAIDRIGLPAVEVVSNLDAFHPPPLWFYVTHTMRNASVAHLLGGGLRTWIYASAHDYRQVNTKASSVEIAHADPFALPLISTSALRLGDSGTRYRRVDKTAIVADIPLSWDYLDVCSNIYTPGAEQCSDCMKCRRTLMTLEVLGVIGRFERIFDLAHWSAVRDEYLWQVLTARSDPFKAELRALIDEKGFAVPKRIVLQAGPHAWKRVNQEYRRIRVGARRYPRSVVKRIARSGWTSRRTLSDS